MIKGRAVSAAAASLLLAACTAGSAPTSNPSSPSPSPVPASVSPNLAGTITLTDSGCRFDYVSDAIEVGPMVLTFVNQTSDIGAFHLWQLDNGHAFEEFTAFIAEHRRAFDEGLPDTGPPPFATMVGGEVRTEATDTMTVMASEATYGVACIIPHEGAGRLVATYAAGPIVVGAASSRPEATAASDGVVPAARIYHVMVGLERGIVLFGGATASPPAGGKDLFDTWEYGSADGWVRTQEAETPWADPAAFDAQSGRVVVLLDGGGTSLYDPAADAWSRLDGIGGPTTTFGMRATHDIESDRTVLFDENRRTWAYDPDTDTWTGSSGAASPSSRLWHVMAYDEASDRVILFGGTTRSDADLGDTWAYDLNAGAWQEMSSATSPPARRYAAMAYDPRTDRMILFGGVTGRQEEPLGDTWAYDYDTNTWTEVSPATAPSPRAWHAMAHDPETGVIGLFGGGRTREEATAETWLYDPAGGSWTRSQ